ncbi:MAG: hypothetical protein HFK09_01845 [Clostridia bacterium]|nr:hypothetical protein [Clostridia bacterium]
MENVNNATSNDSQIGGNIDEIMNELDLSELEAFIESLTSDQQSFLEGTAVKDFIKNIVSGQAIDFGTVMNYLLSSFGANAATYVPLMMALIAVAVAYSVINSVKGKFASDSVESIVRFACMGVILTLLITQIFFIIGSVMDMIELLKKQTDIFFPLILTLMTAIGAGSSVNVYRPAVLIFASGIINLITAIAIPMFIVSVVFTAIGNLSSGIKLKEMSSFFSTVSKWVLNTTFFIFMAFLSIQGITASIYDGITIRTTKLALSKYVPIIGGYLSEGFNIILAGSVLIKNSLGLTAVIILLFTVVPHIIRVALLSLSLRLTAAIAEPLGCKEISGAIGDFGKNLTMLISMILGVAFLYFLFIMLVIATGNLSL